MKPEILHNPRCSKSRQTLALLEEKNIEPAIILYLENPPSTDELAGILKKLNKSPRDIIRKKEAVYAQLNLDAPGVTDADLIKAMTQNPVLIERPIVINGEKAAIGRPPENILDIF